MKTKICEMTKKMTKVGLVVLVVGAVVALVGVGVGVAVWLKRRDTSY